MLGCFTLATACGQVDAPQPATTTPLITSSTSSAPTSTAAPTTAAAPAATSTTTTAPASITTIPTTAADQTSGLIQIRIRLDRRVADDGTADFASLAEAVLTDTRGWGQAGFEFTFSETDYDYTVVLAEGPEVDQLCLPYDTGGRFSCQIGPVVALNADRWREAVDSWPASLDDYRTMLVNHEVGHLIGQHHPAAACPADGQPAPVMAQQSSGVVPCTANSWPLDWEIACATQGVEPLAPPYEKTIELTCGPNGALD